MNARMKDMGAKAKFYANAMSTTKTVPDKSEALIKMWWNQAIPAISYGVEALPTPLSLADELESIQMILGKWILGVSRSTANPFVHLKLGFKPKTTRILIAKLSFFPKSEVIERLRAFKKMSLVAREQWQLHVSV